MSSLRSSVWDISIFGKQIKFQNYGYIYHFVLMLNSVLVWSPVNKTLCIYSKPQVIFVHIIISLHLSLVGNSIK